jgi:hypothetical protein
MSTARISVTSSGPFSRPSGTPWLFWSEEENRA